MNKIKQRSKEAGISIQALKRREKYFLQLVEEKQLELIWHPEQREKCSISFAYGYSAQIIYVYREDCPMSAFREYAMFLLFMFYAGHQADEFEDWIPYAAKAINYLRKLPNDTRDRNLEFAYTRIAQLYEESGNPKSEWYRKKADIYQLYTGNITPWDALRMMETMEDDKLFDFCLYVLYHIANQGCFGEDAFYPDWQRGQYELQEYVLDIAVKQFADNGKQSTLVRSFILFLKAIYLKRTRRYALAEVTLKQYLSLPERENDRHWMEQDVIYALLGECCLYRGDKAKAEVYFHKVGEKEKTSVWEYVQSLLGERIAPDELNQACYEAVADACCQNNVTAQPLKNAIDTFFVPPEIYDNEEEENEAEADIDKENSEMPQYTFDEWYEMAEEGDRVAQLVVGYAYYKGGCVARNYRLAREWFYLSALQGNAAAQMNLAYMYAHGYGVEADVQQAAQWREKAEANPNLDLKSYRDLLLK